MELRVRDNPTDLKFISCIDRCPSAQLRPETLGSTSAETETSCITSEHKDSLLLKKNKLPKKERKKKAEVLK